MLDETGTVLARSESLTGDLLHEPVRWTEGNIADWKGQAVSLHFTLRNGQFYSYWLEWRMLRSARDVTGENPCEIYVDLMDGFLLYNAAHFPTSVPAFQAIYGVP